MRLKKVMKSYDLIVSLGSSCSPAIHMRRHGLRKFSMPLDWMVSLSLGDVARLFDHRFHDFMKLEHLVMAEETFYPQYYLDDGEPIYLEPVEKTLIKSYFIKDALYNIISVHDFPIFEGQHWTSSYPAYKAKLDMRIARLWEGLNQSRHPLFIRWYAEYDQAAAMQAALTRVLGGKEFTLLVLNPVAELKTIQEADWKMSQVCVVEVPHDIKDDSLWDRILSGIKLN
ncbi:MULTISPECIES: DUF1796 family putative cysteine peptidase [Paenibacillus]|uniref:DUF1796 family putative cysteine peptidase n=1 Tax=Paenibacillus TaxID=44249 RepID=UPI00041AD3DE|nr:MULTISPECIES: DUF1796 family putative cysteine peptidase [Paenibacillus]